MRKLGIMKVTSLGSDVPPRVEGLPDEALLRHEDAPGEIAEALDVFEAALDESQEAARVHREAEKEARENTLRVKGETDRWLAEVADKVRDEDRALRAATGRARAAGRKVVEVVKGNGDALRTLGARLALEAHARRIEHALNAEEADRDFRRFGGRTYGGQSVALGGGSRPLLDVLDEVPALEIAEQAGTRGDLVEVQRFRHGAVGKADRVLTTRRRAAALVEARGSGWEYVNGEDERGSA